MKKTKRSDTELKDPNLILHESLVLMIKDCLTPLGVKVHVEMPVMSASPKLDVLILRDKQQDWSEEQLVYLCDGLRHCTASHIILEIKISESVNEDVFIKTSAYNTFYRQYQGKSSDEVKTFIISAKTPNKAWLEDAGYKKNSFGIFTSERTVSRVVDIISLNELSDTKHNLMFKLFASKLAQKKKASAIMKQLMKDGLRINGPVLGIMSLINREDQMPKMTIEELYERGRRYARELVVHIDLEDRLYGLSVQDLFETMSAEERVEMQRLLSNQVGEA